MFGQESFSSVSEYFQTYFPGLVDSLGNPGGFWPKVANNTITNKQLANEVLIGLKMGRPDSAVYLASQILLAARTNGALPNPEKT
jgi:hypothetical protein